MIAVDDAADSEVPISRRLANTWETAMDTTTLLIIVIVLLVIGGGGFYGRGRWF